MAIVGRPNTGKSTLFNRLTAARTAIEEKTAGVTRDRLYGIAEWCGRQFVLIDTGGISYEQEDPLTLQVRRQAELAVAEADVILLILDARDGPTALDQEIANLLRRSSKHIIPVVNKVDGPASRDYIYPFFRLGLGEPSSISAAHGREIGDLLDRLLNALPPAPPEIDQTATTKIAVIGRPNVGKSSLVNALLGQERVIVNPLPGTTREAVDTPFEHGGKSYILIDTAGVRRKSRVKEPVEYYSVLRSLKAIERCDLALLLLDGTAELTEQDVRLAGYADQAGRGLIVVVNKWDLVKNREAAQRLFRENLQRSLSFAAYAPVTFLSALTGRRLESLYPLIDRTREEQNRRVTTALLNELIADAVTVNPPPTRKGRRLKIYYGTQPQVKPPTFVFFVNNPQLMHFSYLRYLENRLRAAFGFPGTPLKFNIRAREKGE